MTHTGLCHELENIDCINPTRFRVLFNEHSPYKHQRLCSMLRQKKTVKNKHDSLKC